MNFFSMGVGRLKRFLCLFTVMTLCLFVFSAAAQAGGSPVNILLIGLDVVEADKPARSDTMILLSIDPAAGSVRALSFLRDLYVPIPGCGKTRLNAAYYFGGEELLITTLANNFGIAVDHTVTVSFSLLADVVDRMGGVELDVLPKEVEALNKILASYNQRTGQPRSQNLLTASGLQTLNGVQALSYSRIRSIDSDFQRVGRQQAVIAAMFEKLRSADFLTLSSIVFHCMGQVQTDLGLGDINALLPLATMDDVTVSMARLPFDGLYTEDTINGMQVLVPDREANGRMAREFLEGE